MPGRECEDAGQHVPGMAANGLFPIDEIDVKHATFYRDALAISLGKKPKRSRREKFDYVGNIIYWSILIVIGAWVFSQIIDRKVPTDFQAVVAENPAVAAGRDLRVEFTMDRKRLCSLSYVYEVRDSSGESHVVGPFDVGRKTKIGEDSFVKGYLIRSTWAQGSATWHVEFRYKCPGNYLQAFVPIVWVSPTLHFTILPPIPGEPEGDPDTLQDH